MRKHRSIFIVIIMLLTVVVINAGQIISALIAQQMNHPNAAVIEIVTELLALLLMILLNRFIFKAKVAWYQLPARRQWLLLLPIVIVLIGDATLGARFLLTPENVVLAVVTGLAVGVFEEYVFRGIVIGFLRINFHARNLTLILFSGLAFGALHLLNAFEGNVLNTLLQAVSAVAIGFFFAAIYLITGSLWLPILAHGIIDAFDQLAFQTLSNTAGFGIATSLIYTFSFTLISWLLYRKYLTR